MKNLSFLLLVFLFVSCNQTETNEENSPKENTNDTPVNHQALIGKDYLIDSQHSYIGFKIKYFGFSPVRGRFNNFDGTVFYDATNLAALSVSIAIDAKSINTGNEQRDKDLISEGTWFNTASFPKLMFKSDKVIPYEGGRFDLVGKITIKGITKIDTFHFEKPTALSKDWAANDQVDFSGKATIDRQDFKVFGGDFWSSIMENGLTQLSDKVEIELDIHCRRADYDARYRDAEVADVDKIIADRIKNKGIDSGLELIDSLFQIQKLSAGKLSSIGYTLNAWKMYEQAISVFNKRLKFFPDRTSTHNQLGITNLLLGNQSAAMKNFNAVLAKDSTDSRALEYLRLMDVMSGQ